MTIDDLDNVLRVPMQSHAILQRPVSVVSRENTARRIIRWRKERDLRVVNVFNIRLGYSESSVTVDKLCRPDGSEGVGIADRETESEDLDA